MLFEPVPLPVLVLYLRLGLSASASPASSHLMPGGKADPRTLASEGNEQGREGGTQTEKAVLFLGPQPSLGMWKAPDQLERGVAHHAAVA